MYIYYHIYIYYIFIIIFIYEIILNILRRNSESYVDLHDVDRIDQTAFLHRSVMQIKQKLLFEEEVGQEIQSMVFILFNSHVVFIEILFLV